MRNHMDHNQACTGLVQNYIGTAYDVVKEVYDNLDSIKALGEGIENGQLDNLLDIADQLPALITLLEDFNGKYYGPYAEDPTTRPDESEMQNGDMYFNTVYDAMYIYDGEIWSALAENLSTLEIFHIKDEDVTTNGTAITLSNIYAPGNNNLAVYVNAAYQYPVTQADGTGGYLETDSHTITFPEGNLETNDIVVVVVSDILSTTRLSMTANIEEYVIAVDGTKFITLPAGMTYIPGTNNLEVFVDGLRQVNDVDYTETSTTEVTFTTGLPINALVVFKIGNVIGDGFPGLDLTNQFQVLDVAADFNNRHAFLSESLPIFLRGFNCPGDGGAGFFIYNPLAPRVTANRGVLIDPTVSLGAQGSGLGNGCWKRQYTHEVSSLWFGEEHALVGSLNSYGTPLHGDFITLDGFRTVGDGGEGILYWDENMPKTAHDGGTVIDNTKNFPMVWNNQSQMADWFTHNVTGYGCWTRPHPEEATLNWFGCVGDGTTHNGYVFLGIAKAIFIDNVTKLKVPSGTYLINTDSVFDVEFTTSNFMLYGVGAESKITFSDLSNTVPFKFTGSDNITIQDVTFINTQTTAATALDFSNCSDVTVEKCSFTDFKNRTITVHENLDNFQKLACNDVTIKDNVFTGCSITSGKVLDIQPKLLSKNLNITDNRFIDCGNVTNAIIYAGLAIDNGTIENNIINNAIGSGIHVEAYESIKVIDNTINDFGTFGIQLHAGNNANYLSPTLSQLECKNNYINQTGLGTYGIKITGTTSTLDNFLVRENTILGCGGIYCAPTVNLDNILISDNLFESVAKDYLAILVDNTNGGALNEPKIINNIAEGDDLTRSECLVLLDTCLKPLVQGNTLRRFGEAGIKLTQCTDAKVVENVFIESNVSSVSDASIIYINNTSATTYYVKGNHVAQGNAEIFIDDASGDALLYTSNNILDSSITLVCSATTVPVTDGTDNVSQAGPTRHFYSTTAPASGSYIRGDITWNVTPVAAGSVGWVCTVSGTPGTWKTFGNIEA